jgi:hypothetical protein
MHKEKKDDSASVIPFTQEAKKAGDEQASQLLKNIARLVFKDQIQSHEKDQAIHGAVVNFFKLPAIEQTALVDRLKAETYKILAEAEVIRSQIYPTNELKDADVKKAKAEAEKAEAQARQEKAQADISRAAADQAIKEMKGD